MATDNSHPDTPTVLKKILANKAEEVTLRRQAKSEAQLQRECEALNRDFRGFANALTAKNAAGQSAVIAEVKKASPSKGVIREQFDPVDIAKSYEQGGAACLSVLTEQRYFLGADEYLQAARAATQLPVIRKDFIMETYQVYESCLLGADCILLIVAALEQHQLQALHNLAFELGLDVLVEVHNRAELDRALTIDNPMIGINNRDLNTFNTTLDTTISLLNHIPEDRLVITESGILTHNDVAIMRQHNVNAFLVGESFMRADKPGEKLQAMFG